jgi:hypothetical protein
LKDRTKRSTAEVLVSISYSLPRSSGVVVALQGVATTYHDALKVSQSIMLFVSPPCPLAARWGRVGWTEVGMKVSIVENVHVDDPTFVFFVGD